MTIIGSYLDQAIQVRCSRLARTLTCEPYHFTRALVWRHKLLPIFIGIQSVLVALLETRFSRTLSIILVFTISILNLNYNLSTSIFSFELLITHLNKHVIIHFVGPSSLQLSSYATIDIVVSLINIRMLTWASGACESIRVHLLVI